MSSLPAVLSHAPAAMARPVAATGAAELMRRLFYTGLGLCAWAVVDHSAGSLIQLGAFTADMQSTLDERLHEETRGLPSGGRVLPAFPFMLAAREAACLAEISASSENAVSQEIRRDSRRL